MKFSIPSDLRNLAELLTARTKNPYDVSSWKEISHYPSSFTDNREYEPKCGGGGSCGG